MRAADLEEPSFNGTDVSVHRDIGPALQAFADSGLTAATFSEAHGGVDLPFTVSRACFAWPQAANIATAAYPMLTMANASLLIAHGTPGQIADYAVP